MSQGSSLALINGISNCSDKLNLRIFAGDTKCFCPRRHLLFEILKN